MSFQQFTGTATYLASPELRDAVNVAVPLSPASGEMPRAASQWTH